MPLDQLLADLDAAIAAAGGIAGVVRSEYFDGLDPQESIAFLTTTGRGATV